MLLTVTLSILHRPLQSPCIILNGRGRRLGKRDHGSHSGFEVHFAREQVQGCVYLRSHLRHGSLDMERDCRDQAL